MPESDAQALLRGSEARLHLLTEVGLVLSRFLEPNILFKELAPHLIPTLGDACFIDLIDRRGDIARIAWAHVRKDRQAEFDALWPRIPPTRFELHPSAMMISKGDAIFEPQVDDAWMQRASMDETHLSFMRTLGLHSVIVVPMRLEGTPFGAITLWFTEKGSGPHTEADLELAVDLARRAAFATASARQQDTLRRLNSELESQIEARTRERDRIWLVSDEMMSVADRDGYLTAVNPAWHRLLGHDEAALLSTPFREFTHPDEQAQASQVTQRLERGETVVGYEARMRHADGSWRWISWTVVPEGGLYYAIGRDITAQHVISEEIAAANRQLQTQIEERERVEATLQQMQRLETIGQLTSGVAHDFNNLLTVILGNTAFLERQLRATADAKLAMRLANMRTAAERGAKLTTQLLAFSRKQYLAPAALDLNDTVHGMADLLQTTLGGGIRIEESLAEELWPAFADPTQIELVILNLAINARDAMEAGGTLSITTQNVTLGPGEKPEEPLFGEYVAVAVRDSGVGMSAEVRKKAFEPFFTTKELGRGSGLGLSQVLGFAKQSGGGVRLESVEGLGTTVTVYLPRARQARRSEVARTEGGRAAQTVGPARILLVDDEPPVREVIASELRDLGHEVIEAGSGGAALEALDRDAPFDAAVLDFAMPGMNGAELARQIRARRPDMCVLFVTGYADTSELSQIADELIVRKPLIAGDLTRKLQAALAAE